MACFENVSIQENIVWRICITSPSWFWVMVSTCMYDVLVCSCCNKVNFLQWTNKSPTLTRPWGRNMVCVYFVIPNHSLFHVQMSLRIDRLPMGRETVLSKSDPFHVDHCRAVCVICCMCYIPDNLIPRADCIQHDTVKHMCDWSTATSCWEFPCNMAGPWCDLYRCHLDR